MLYYLVERAARVMRGLGLQCRTVSVHISYSDSQADRATRSLSTPTELDREIFGLALKMLRGLYTRRASLHGIGVRLSGFSSAGERQRPLFGQREAWKQAALCHCLDRLRRKYGHSVILTGNALDALVGLRRDRYGFLLRTPCLTK